MKHATSAAVPSRSRISPWSVAGLGILLLAMLLLGGCATGGSTSATADSDDATPGSSREVNLRAGIPDPAREVAEGRGSLNYRAQGAGQVYVYDVSDNKIVGTYNVSQGQELIIDARASRATLASNELKIAELRGNRRYVLYFLPFDAQTYELRPTNRN